MDTQRPAIASTIARTSVEADAILARMRESEKKCEEEEVSWLNKEIARMQRRAAYISRKIAGRVRQPISEEIAVPEQATPDPFKIPKEEWQRIHDSLNRPRQPGEYDISMQATQLLNAPAHKTDTGDIPLTPVSVESAPKVSVYTADEALILLVRHAIQAHEAKYLVPPDVVEMPKHAHELLASIDMKEYVSVERHIPFAINLDLPVNRTENTIKCITY